MNEKFLSLFDRRSKTRKADANDDDDDMTTFGWWLFNWKMHE